VNCIYRSIWSEALGTWIAVSEIVKSNDKDSRIRKKILAAGLLLCSSTVWALPVGEQVVSGQATVARPNATQMQIQQSSQKAIVNWQGFSISPNEVVNIQQPSFNAALLNRVVGMDASVIQGQLNANGQIYLVNPNGVLFSNTAQVDVGGLIASTHNISDTDFLNGHYHFMQNNATGMVSNQGIIQTPAGGVVALIGNQVSNEGSISTPGGTTALAAGKTVDLDFQGNGLVEVKIPEAALNAQINNKGAILADGGRVVLTAQAANQLAGTVINSQGLIQAKGLVERNGEIILDGGNNGTVQVSGRLDASGQNSGGTIKVLAGMSNGTVNVAGILDASAPNAGNGGFIETSAAHVKLADSLKVNTLAANGQTGNWLIDPPAILNDYTIAASGGNITGALLGSNLNSTNITISTATQGTAGGNGDIFVNDAITWTSANILTLNADRNIYINAPITINGNGNNGIRLNFSSGDYFLNNGGKITWTSTSGSKVFAVNGTPYSVIQDVNQLQNINAGLSGNYVLGTDIDASATSGWVSATGTGFEPIGDSVFGFTGQFDGLGHTISALTIHSNRTAGRVGLFGNVANNGMLRNIGLLNATITSPNTVGFYQPTGILAGVNNGTIHDAYATGSVTGDGSIGGLVGFNAGTIEKAYAIGNVTAVGSAGGLVGGNTGNISNAYAMGSVVVNSNQKYGGGLVGVNAGTINNTYATGDVTGTIAIGGLVGDNNGAISNSYATGNVTAISDVGGLVGHNGNIINNSFWDTQTTNQSNGVGRNDGTLNNVLGKNTAEMRQLSTFSSAGWDIDSTGSTGKVWRIYEGNTSPLLRSFLTPLKVTANNSTIIYNGFDNTLNSVTYTNALTNAIVSPNANLLGSVSFSGTGKNVGSYSVTPFALYSNQPGYDISYAAGALTINKANLALNAVSDSKTYDGTVSSAGVVNISGLVGTDTVSNLSQIFANKNVLGLNASTLNIAGGYSVNDGNGGANYTIVTNNALGTISPATLTITANDYSKIYDGLAYSGGNGVSFAGLVNGEDSSILFGSLGYGGDSQGAINPGVYSITPYGLTADNYQITYQSGLLSVNLENCIVSCNPPPTPPPSENSTFEIGGGKQPSTAIRDVTEEFTGNREASSNTNQLFSVVPMQTDAISLVYPELSIKNSAGRVIHVELSANREFLSLLLEDGSVRIWDFQRGMQRRISGWSQNQVLTDISAVDNQGELISIASASHIGAYDVISSSAETAINESDVNYFVISNDGNLLLLNTSANNMTLWDNTQNKRLWKLPYQRGAISGFALTDNKKYAAVLSHQSGSYLLPANLQLKGLTDAIDLVDLSAGKTVTSLPNLGEHVVYMRFKNNSTLQIGLASGEMLDWPINSDKPKTLVNFAEPITAVDTVNDIYSYLLQNGTVRIANNQGQVKLSIENKADPFQHAFLLEEGKKLLTVLASGDLALWDVASGKKLLRLFSMQQGWTVMDAFGRFDGSEEALENFSWLAGEEDIPLDSFSENYYEPGLLANVLQNQDYLSDSVNSIKSGINLPPKVDLQMANQQSKTDSVTLELNIYDRGGGIDKLQIYQNGKALHNEEVILKQEVTLDNKVERHTLTLNVIPTSGNNTVKVVASNNMGIENSSTELSFDGKTKAYASAIRLMTVGLNEYSDDKLNLSYSVADAALIEQTIKNNAKVVASKSLYNQNATKPKILAELKELSQGAQQDVLVIYLAGHGIAVGKEWYFLPYETKLDSNLEKIVANGITATELSNIFKYSKIQHILLMVDACYSGAGMDVFDKLQNGQRYFSRQLSRSLGITVVTATTKNQEAAELESLGHGVFTYMIAQEIQKKENSGAVTAHDIAKKIVEVLPAFSKKQTGIVQEPTAYTHGSDFILTDVLKKK
jgi:filamentous hemagglutinin family protein